MQDSLRGMVQRVRQASDEHRALQQRDRPGRRWTCRHRTEQAAANLEESAASMEEISATGQPHRASTDEASRMAQRNAAVATQGGR
jgi:methyl-accepting chemotaxis protein